LLKFKFVDLSIAVDVEAASPGTFSGSFVGIMGFAWPPLSFSKLPTVWEVLADAGKLSEPQFSFFLTRYHSNNSATYLEPGGLITLGGSNKRLYTGKIEFYDLTLESGWILDLKGERSSLKLAGSFAY
jgi:cathepsin D